MPTQGQQDYRARLGALSPVPHLQVQAGLYLDSYGDIALLLLDKDVVGAGDHWLVVIDVQQVDLQRGGGRQVPAIGGLQREVVHRLLLPVQQLAVFHCHRP